MTAIDGPGGVAGGASMGPTFGASRYLTVTFDTAENWTYPSAVLTNALLHEVGHTLGLTHSPDPSSIMYPSLHGQTALQPSDIAAVQAIYGQRPQSTTVVRALGLVVLTVNGIQKYP
jgi:hypothetical protein